MYSNNELTEAKVQMKYKYYQNKVEIKVTFSTLSIPNFVEITTDGVYVNGNRYISLFDTFSAILVMFMQQIRLLYLYDWMYIWCWVNA